MTASSFWKLWCWIQTVYFAASADHKCSDSSAIVLRSFTHCDIWGPYLLPYAMLQRQLLTVLVFNSGIWTLCKFCTSRTNTFTAFLLTLSSKSFSTFLQPSLVGPRYVERLCWTICWANIGKLAVLTKPPKSTRVGSVGASTIDDTKWRGSGWSLVFSAIPEKTFLVPVPDRITDTFMAVLRDWIEPGTTVIRDCWSAYRDKEAHGYTPKTMHHTTVFVNVRTAAHTTVIRSNLRHVKAFLKPHN